MPVMACLIYLAVKISDIRKYLKGIDERTMQERKENDGNNEDDSEER